MTRGPLTLWLVLASAVAVGCGKADGNGVPIADRGLIGQWTDSRGRALPDGSSDRSGGLLVVRSLAGSTTCDNDHVTVFLEVAWPVGQELDTNLGITDETVPRFVRDTSGSSLKFTGESNFETQLPADAVAADFHLNGNSLYTVSADTRAVYVRRPNGAVEHWPRLLPDLVCTD